MAETCASKGLQRPVWRYTEQSRKPQRATTPCWHLEPKQGIQDIGQEQVQTHVASDEILVLGKWPLVPEQVAPCFFLLLA